MPAGTPRSGFSCGIWCGQPKSSRRRCNRSPPDVIKAQTDLAVVADPNGRHGVVRFRTLETVHRALLRPIVDRRYTIALEGIAGIGSYDRAGAGFLRNAATVVSRGESEPGQGLAIRISFPKSYPKRPVT